MNAFEPRRIKENLHWLSQNVHVAGTQEQILIMDGIEDRYRALGFSVKTYEYDVLLSYPDYSHPNTIHVWSEITNKWILISEGRGVALGPGEVI